MNKKILALGLSMTFILSIGNNAYAKDNPSDVPIASIQKDDTHTYLYEVIKLEDEKITLLYQGEITEDSIMMEEIDKNTDLELDKEFFEEDVIIHDKYEITSNKTLSKLDSKDIKKEDVKLKSKYEKPKNMAKEDLPDNTESMDFVIENLEGNTDEGFAAIVSEVGNENNKYSISSDKLRDDNPKVGDQYTIFWDGIKLESFPAQFGKIFRVKKHQENANKNEKADSKKVEFEVLEIEEDGVRLGEVGNKDNLYYISFEDLKDENPAIGDRYMITWSGNSTRSIPAQFIDIMNVDKWKKKASQTKLNLDEINEAIKKADDVLIGDGSFTEQSVERFQNAFENAKDLVKKTDHSQEEIDKAAKELNAAMEGLTEQTGEITRQFVIKEIGEKGGKFARLVDVDYKDKEFNIGFDSLGEPNAKVGDIFMITFGKVDPNVEPYQMGQIIKIEKVTNYGRLIDEIEKAKKAYDKNKTYTKESLDAYNKAFETAQNIIAKNSLDSQENIDKAISELEKATAGLKEYKKESKTKAPAKDNKTKAGKVLNPRTGVASIVPYAITGILALGGLRKTKNK